MSTPVIGTEPTLGAESPFAIGNAGAESSDVGIFEQVLHDLLDSDTKENEMGVGISPYLLMPFLVVSVEASWGGTHSPSPTPVAWERGNGVPLAQAVGEPLQAGGIDAPPHHDATGEALKAIETPPAHSVEEGAGVKAKELFLDHLMAEQQGESAEPMTLLGGDFQSVQGGSAGLDRAVDSRPVNGNEGTLPVSSARQGETPSSPVLEPPNTEAPAFLERKGPEHLDLTHNDQHRTHTPHAAHTTHWTASVGYAEPSAIAPQDRLAEPNWHMAEQMAQHIERMVYDRERDTITVRLDPPELGVIELRVQASGNGVQAWVSAERDLTRELLQQTQQQLREQLGSRGLQLTHFDVGGQGNSRYTQAQPLRTPAIQAPTATHPSTAPDSLWYDGRWSVWV